MPVRTHIVAAHNALRIRSGWSPGLHSRGSGVCDRVQTGSPEVRSGRRPERPQDKYAVAGRAYISYVAEYSIDAQGGTVEHRFRHAAFPNWEGLSQTRYFSLSDDGERLELTTDAQVFGGNTVTAALVWEREP
jgi:hypothetical protein